MQDGVKPHTWNVVGTAVHDKCLVCHMLAKVAIRNDGVLFVLPTCMNPDCILLLEQREQERRELEDIKDFITLAEA